MRDSIYAKRAYAIAIPYVRLSVRLSHGWISQKWLKLGSCNFHHTVAPVDRPVLSAMHRLRWYIAGRSSARGLQSQYSERKWRFSSFMCQYLGNGTRYVQCYYRNLHKCFRLAARLMTLDDLELLYVWIFSEFRVISQIWEATTAKRVTIDLYCQRCIDYVDILLRVPPLGGLQSQYRGWKWQFSTSTPENIPQFANHGYY